MAPVLTAADSILWTQRIEKEELVNARSKGAFSVRAAISVADVPKEFKPGHVDPTGADKKPRFDPEKVGLSGTYAKEFRRCINRDQVGPRERHQFPETMMQEIGWCQGRSGPVIDRSEPAGSNPSNLGLGWQNVDGHGTIAREAAKRPTNHDALDAAMNAERNPRPRGTQPGGNPREVLGVPPFCTSMPVARRFPAEASAACAMPASALERQRGYGGSASASVISGGVASSSAGRSRRGKSQADHPRGLEGASKSGRSRAGDKSEPSVARSASLSAFGATGSQERIFNKQEQSMDDSAKYHQREFMNRFGNKWYHPLSNSDVAVFADEYTKAWGRQLYAKVPAKK